jgi:hypothetical protein
MSTLGVFNLGTSKNSGARGAEEGVHYKIVKDGNNLEHKILNFENPDLCPRTGIIELEPLKSSRRHLNHVSFRIIKDKEYGVLVGIPLDVDPKTKQLIFQKITLEEHETLDLSIPEQAMKWACIKRSHFYTKKDAFGKELNPNFQAGSKTQYKAIDKEADALRFEKERRIKRSAIDIAESLIGIELEDFALNIGLDPRMLSPKTLWMEVVKYAEEKPLKFMEVWNSDSRVELSVLKRGISMGVISETIDKGINYNGLTLGFNEPEAVKYLKDHPSTRVSIDALSRKTDEQSEASMRVEPVIVDEKDAEIQRLKKQLAQMQTNAREATEKAIELQTESDLLEADPELAELIKEAKSLDVRGVHNMKDKAKIRLKIDEKKRMIKN